MRRKKLSLDGATRSKGLSGKTYIVTGANSGVGLEATRLLGQHAGQSLRAGDGQRTGASGRGRGLATIPKPRHHAGPTARRLHQSVIDGFQCLSRVATHPAHGEPVEPRARPSTGSGRAAGLQPHNFGKALPPPIRWRRIFLAKGKKPKNKPPVNWAVQEIARKIRSCLLKN